MKKFRFVIVAMLAIMIPLALATNAFAYTMEVNKTASYYSKASTKAKYKKGTYYFGKEVSATSVGKTWTKLKINGKTRYMKTSNLSKLVYTTTSSSGQVYSDKTLSNSLGYALVATKVQYQGYSTIKGTKYFKVTVPQTHTGSLGTKKKNSTVTGYISSSYLRKYSDLKTAAQNARLYDRASDKSKYRITTLTAGTDMKLLSSNSTWAKVDVDGTVGYVKKKYLKSYTLRVLTDTLDMHKTASLNSPTLGMIPWDASVTVHDYFTVGTRMPVIWAHITYKDADGIATFENISHKRLLGMTTTAKTSGQTTAYASPSTEAATTTVHNFYRPKVVATYGDWSKVLLGRTFKWMQNSDLEVIQYKVSGNYYASVPKMIGEEPAGTITDQVVRVVALDNNLGFMKVVIDGENRYMRTDSIVEGMEGQQMYVAATCPKVYEFANTNSTFLGRLTYMEPVRYLGIARTVSSGDYLAVEFRGGVYYIFQKFGAELLTDTPVTFQFDAANPMQESIINRALQMAFEEKTDYSQIIRGKQAADGSYCFDCSCFAGWLLDVAVREHTGFDTWTVAMGTTTWTSSKCLARKIARTENCIEGTELFPTQTLWEVGDELDGWRDNLECGDLLFFRMSPSASCIEHKVVDLCADHIGVYLGNGLFAHCSSRFGGVVITPLQDDYTCESKIVKIMRFLPTDDYLAWIDDQISLGKLDPSNPGGYVPDEPEPDPDDEGEGDEEGEGEGGEGAADLALYEEFEGIS